MANAAGADTRLELLEFPITSSPSLDTRPTVGLDPLVGAPMVVFTRVEVGDGFGLSDIYFQYFSSLGVPIGEPVLISESATDDLVNDVWEDHIVYAAFAPGSSAGIVTLYRISYGQRFELSARVVLEELRTHGNHVVWVEGTPGARRVMLFDLDDLGRDIPARALAGPAPAATGVEIGDRFVVWEEEEPSNVDRPRWRGCLDRTPWLEPELPSTALTPGCASDSRAR